MTVANLSLPHLQTVGCTATALSTVFEFICDLADGEPRQSNEKQEMTDFMSTTINRTLRRLPNSAYRTREYLTEAEVERLIEAARKRGRNGARDACAILLAYRHGLWAQELLSATMVAD